VINRAPGSAVYFAYFKTRTIHCCDLTRNRFLVNHRTISNTGSMRGQRTAITSLPRCELRNVNGWSDNGNAVYGPAEFGHQAKDLYTRRDKAWLIPVCQNLWFG